MEGVVPRIAYVNGRYVPHREAVVHIEDRGLQFADSVYEVIALIGGRLADETGHLDRLQRSLHELKMPPPVSRRALRLILHELARRNRIENAMIYMQVTRGVAPRDFKIPKQVSPGLIMMIRPVSYDIAARKAAGKKAVTVPDIRWQRRDIKTTAMVAQVLAKQAAAERGADEAWLVDGKGMITEASSSNAWIVDKKGNLITRPTAGHAILKGVTRNALQKLCREKGIRIVERAFSIAEARQAAEAFTSAATALIVPIVEIDGKKIGNGKIGPVTSAVFDLYMEYARDNARKQEHWSPI